MKEGAQPLQEFARLLNKAIDLACGRCDNGTTLPDWENFVMTVRDAMREEGFGANFDWEHGETGGLGSELSIWRGARYESYQIVTTAKRVRRPPNSFMGEGTLKLPTHGCILESPLAPGYEVGIRLGKYAAQQWDATAYLQDRGAPNFPPPGWTGACRAHQCDLSTDHDWESGLQCTQELCGETIDFTLQGDGIINWTSGSRVKVTVNSQAVLKACCTEVEACTTVILGQ